MRNFSHGLGVLSASQQSLRISRFHWSLRNRHISRSNVRFQKISVLKSTLECLLINPTELQTQWGLDPKII